MGLIANQALIRKINELVQRFSGKGGGGHKHVQDKEKKGSNASGGRGSNKEKQ